MADGQTIDSRPIQRFFLVDTNGVSYGATGNPIFIASAFGSITTQTQITVTASQTLLLAANVNRLGAVLVNAGGTNVAYISSSPSVSASGSYGGTPLSAGSNSNPGGSFTDTLTRGAWYATVSSGTTNMSVMEISG